MPSPSSHRARAGILASLGAGERAIGELLPYTENVFRDGGSGCLALDDEPFVAHWEPLAAQATRHGASRVLPRALVPLRFPVRPGMSREHDYRAAVDRGAPTTGLALATGLVLERPDAVSLQLASTAGGRLPVITVGHRPDFENILRALVAANEPVPVPAATGAMMIVGRGEHDRVMVVGEGPYSAVAGADLGIDRARFDTLSREIRVHHEGAHYFTRRRLGSMRNNLLDELIADYVGMVHAIGRFRADWFLRFMGLECFPAYRAGGRLQNYRGEPPLSGEAFIILQRLARRAAGTVERFDRAARASGHRFGALRGALGIARLTLEDLAAGDADARLAAATPG